jgi:hypothetical protein
MARGTASPKKRTPEIRGPLSFQGGERSIDSIYQNAVAAVSSVTNKTYSVVIKSWILAKVAGPIPDTS